METNSADPLATFRLGGFNKKQLAMKDIQVGLDKVYEIDLVGKP